MKMSIQPLVARAAFSGCALFAQQDITGTWQGTLQAGGRELRRVYKITKADGALKAIMYSIDQSPPGLPAGAITVRGATVRMPVPGIGGAYEGKLNADGTSMAGNRTQGGAPPSILL
jgi:hypothetical protein